MSRDSSKPEVNWRGQTKRRRGEGYDSRICHQKPVNKFAIGYASLRWSISTRSPLPRLRHHLNLRSSNDRTQMLRESIRQDSRHFFGMYNQEGYGLDSPVAWWPGFSFRPLLWPYFCC